MKRFNPLKVITFLVLFLWVAILVAAATGAVMVPLVDMIKALLSIEPTPQQNYNTIILDIRLPRVFLAAIVGAILALSGAVMQGLFRNPLADPSLIGVTAGASVGASLVIVLAATYSHQWIGLPLISLGAFGGGVTAVCLVYRLATGAYGTSVATMLLAGIGISALAGSVTGLLEFYADNEMLRRMSLWRMGGLDGANYIKVIFALCMLLLLLILLPQYSQVLNALLLGESEARHLGIDTEGFKKIAIVSVAAAVGISVALAGVIGFIGLIVPHILRLIIGPNHRFLLPASALGGACLLVVADNLSRILLAPTELPVGLITAFIGVPFFISLLKRRYVYGLH